MNKLFKLNNRNSKTNYNRNEELQSKGYWEDIYKDLLSYK